jgi:hypothetical protein
MAMTPEQLAANMRAHPFAEQREQIMTKVTLAALRASQLRTPVRTGTLRRSETTAVDPGGLRGYVGTNIVYAPFVHEGTRYMAARPFFAEGIADALPDIQRILGQAGDDYFASLL